MAGQEEETRETKPKAEALVLDNVHADSGAPLEAKRRPGDNSRRICLVKSGRHVVWQVRRLFNVKLFLLKVCSSCVSGHMMRNALLTTTSCPSVGVRDGIYNMPQALQRGRPHRLCLLKQRGLKACSFTPVQTHVYANTLHDLWFHMVLH